MEDLTLGFVIGINIGITIGFWGYWLLLDRNKSDLLKIPEKKK